jgi:hypothetical protein
LKNDWVDDVRAAENTSGARARARGWGFGLLAIALAGGTLVLAAAGLDAEGAAHAGVFRVEPGLAGPGVAEVVADRLGRVSRAQILRFAAAAIELGNRMPLVGGLSRPGFVTGRSRFCRIRRTPRAGSTGCGARRGSTYRVGGDSAGDSGLRRAPTDFVVDRRLSAPVKPEDYVRTGFDRGHLAPNLAIGRWFGAEAQRETFLMSNVVPQAPEL